MSKEANVVQISYVCQKKTFSVLHFNVRSLGANFDPFCQML